MIQIAEEDSEKLKSYNQVEQSYESYIKYQNESGTKTLPLPLRDYIICYKYGIINMDDTYWNLAYSYNVELNVVYDEMVQIAKEYPKKLKSYYQVAQSYKSYQNAPKTKTLPLRDYIICYKYGIINMDNTDDQEQYQKCSDYWTIFNETEDDLDQDWGP